MHADGLALYSNSIDDVEVFFTDTNLIRRTKNGTNTDIAGSLTSGYSGDGGLAINALLATSMGVTISPNREIYIADTGNSVIRKINSTGYIHTIAGTGTSGHSGDGGLAVNAKLFHPRTVTVTSEGEILIADTSNHVIRKITKDGYIFTIAGKPSTSGYGGDGGLAKDALLSSPQCVRISPSGDIFIVEYGGARIRKINSKGIISTFLGTGQQKLSGDGLITNQTTLNYPVAIAFGLNGIIYFAESGGLRKLTPICVEGSILMENGLCEYQCFGYTNLNSSIVCSGKGECISFNVCECKENYYGSSCEKFKCFNVENNSSNVCSSHGMCVSHNNCSCIEGYHGLNCDLFECNGIPSNDSKVCSGKGNCTLFNQCLCELGYLGNDCQQFYCNSILNDNSSVCSSKGLCLSPNNCSCFDNFRGDNCEMYDCYGVARNDSSVCSSHGICTSFNNCSCQVGYYGNNCELTSCFGVEKVSSHVCNGNGTCASFDMCNCFDNSRWFGKNCNLTYCFGNSSDDVNVCNSHGDCLNYDICHCRPHYIGNQCQFRFNSQQMNFTFNSSIDYLEDITTILLLSIQDLQFIDYYSRKKIDFNVTFFLNNQFLWNQVTQEELRSPLSFSLPSSLSNGSLLASITLSFNSTLISLETVTLSPLLIIRKEKASVSNSIPLPKTSISQPKKDNEAISSTSENTTGIIVVAVVVPVVTLGALGVGIAVIVLVVILMKKKAATSMVANTNNFEMK
ncbi:predicted protein [Naegleria gruberi]|uniref:Predicted protein n=1 Tax=Naegleria gruberi TaxID=5762 RepID=D2VNW7_NAEGR|nr:uncharacterized protein NAEGRDRAFT_70644 [Naegleria gruberi]EFC41491.1 predicted protein [Naegleria gruberi]|eukprot:XP_002674235.1 predicted protein [Naegleria gruberi strain NEG-M]